MPAAGYQFSAGYWNSKIRKDPDGFLDDGLMVEPEDNIESLFFHNLLQAYTAAMLELIIVLLATAAGVIWIYNRLVRDRNQVDAGWSDIDVQLKRRHELIPRLVECVKAYADYEKTTLQAVTELRARSEQASDFGEKATIEEAIEAGLHKLVVTVEDYPELKADANFRELQNELADTENQIQYARRFYNGAVRNLNTRIQSFPHLLIAGPLGFKSAQFFAVDDEGERTSVSVKLK